MTHPIPIDNLYYLLCYAWRHVREADVVRREELAGLDGTHHLLGKVLAEGTFRLIRQGIDRGYREIQEDLAGIRGKLSVSETAKRALRARGRAACEFEELSHDVLHNRILRSTLAALLKLPDLDPRRVRPDIRTAYSKLDGISPVRLERRLFRRVQLDRNRRLYRFLMSVCELIHDCLIVEERSGSVRFRDLRRDEYRMPSLFEDFAIEFYRREQDDYRVNPNPRGRGIRWDDEGTREDQRPMIPRMAADVILESEHRRIVLDTKYYRQALSDHRGARKLRSGHLYQLLAYLHNREATSGPGPRHEGILLYPVVDEPLKVDVRLEGFVIRARGIDLGQDWRRIHTDMLALLDD